MPFAIATVPGGPISGIARFSLSSQRVTSKGGTTYAAITSMQADGVDAAVRRAVLAAQKRAAELGKEFG